MLSRWLVFCAILLVGSAASLPSVAGSVRQSPALTWRIADRFGSALQADGAPEWRARAGTPVVTPARGNVVQPLNAVGHGLAQALGWGYAGGIADGFRGRGYCAATSWIVRYADSWAQQGDERGTLHPNREGHRFIGERIAESLREMLGR